MYWTCRCWLREKGHDIFSIYEEARGIDDDGIIKMAFAENRILITNDKDFGEKIFRHNQPHKGVILLRLEDEGASNKIVVLHRLLVNYSNRLSENFTVVTETKIRIVRL